MRHFTKEREAFERLLNSAEEPVNLRRVYDVAILPECAIEISKEDDALLDALFGEMSFKITFKHKPTKYKFEIEAPSVLMCSHIEVGGRNYVSFPGSIMNEVFSRIMEFFEWEL